MLPLIYCDQQSEFKGGLLKCDLMGVNPYN
jgi:hypothetical protein